MYSLNTFLLNPLPLFCLNNTAGFIRLQASMRNHTKWDGSCFYCSAVSCSHSSGSSRDILSSLALFFIFFPLLHACSDVAPAEVFQRGQIVPEAASGTMTTTGQVCQPNKPPPSPLPGAMMHARAHTRARPQTHARTHTVASTQTAGRRHRKRKMTLPSPITCSSHKGAGKTPPHPDGSVTCSSVSLSVLSTSHGSTS